MYIWFILRLGSIASIFERIQHWFLANGPTTEFISVSYEDAQPGTLMGDFVQHYLIEFLTSPHPLLGRKGPVCPFVSKALRQGKIAVAVLTSTSQKDIQAAVLQAKRSFMQERVDGDLYRAKVLLFPNFQDGQVIDQIQVKLKKSFVRDGLMIGEFHKDNDTPALNNPKSTFRPLQTEIPALAIRSIVPGDLAFLTLDSYSWWMQIQLLASYLRTFGNDSVHQKQNYEARRTLGLTCLKLCSVVSLCCVAIGCALWWHWHRYV